MRFVFYVHLQVNINCIAYSNIDSKFINHMGHGNPLLADILPGSKSSSLGCICLPPPDVTFHLCSLMLCIDKKKSFA